METPWHYSFDVASQDKRGSRTAVRPGGIAELVGMDGRETGSIRTFPGFKQERQLGGTLTSPASGGSTLDPNATTTAPALAGNHTLRDCVPFSINIGSDNKASGYVYRLAAGDDSRILIDYRRQSSTLWSTVDVSGWLTSGSSAMDVQEFGRFLYVGVAGDRIFRISFDESANIVATSDVGPGAPPALGFAPKLGVSAKTDTPEALTSPGNPAADSPATANILFFGLTGNTASVSTYADLDNPTVGSAVPRSSTPIDSFANIEHSTGNAIYDTIPSAYTETVAGDRFPSFIDRVEKYPNGTVLSVDQGSAWDSTARRLGEPNGLIRGAYSFAYELYDTRTGLRSTISPIVDATPSDDHAYQASVGGSQRTPVFTNANIAEDDGMGGTNYTDASGYEASVYRDVTFPAIDIVYDSDKYDTLLVYRSLRSQGNASTPSQYRNLALDSTITLADYEVAAAAQSSLTGTNKRSLYFLRLTDAELASQQPLIPQFDFEPSVPAAGALGLYNSTMFYGNLAEQDNAIGAVPFFRYSSTYQVSPEMLSVFNRLTLTLPSEDIVAWETVGANLIGLSNYQPYIIRGEGVQIRNYPAHTGYGVVNHKASEVVTNELYYTTNQGVKKIQEDGALYDLEPLDYLIYNEWRADLSVLEMVFDSVTKCLFIHNPNKNKQACLWMNKGLISENWYSAFDTTGRGPVARTSGTNPEFDDRATFSRIQYSSASKTANYSVNVYTVATSNQLGQTHLLGNLDYNNDNAAVAMAAATTTLTLETDMFTSGIDLGEFTYQDISRSFFFFKDGPEAGKPYIIDWAEQGTVISVKDNLYNTKLYLRRVDGTISGDLDTTGTTRYQITASPNYFRFVGAPCGWRPDGGEYQQQIPDKFTQKYVDGISCSFSDVTVNGGNTTTFSDHLRYTASVQTDNSGIDQGSQRATGADGEGHRTIVQGASDIITPVGNQSGEFIEGISSEIVMPVVEIYTSGVDFRLVGVRVNGKIQGGRKSNRRP